MRAFAKRYRPYGFREGAFRPCYGLAESTLAVSFARGIPTERVRAEPLLKEGRVELASPGEASAVEIVSCGRKFKGHGLKIVSTEKPRVELPEHRVGEILIKGPSVTPGYFRDAKKTRETITSRGWLKTGDLGYLTEDGQLFVCGRLKDVIIVRGLNYYPQDLEWAASRVEGVRDVAAFGANKPGPEDREAVVIVAVSKVSPERREELEAAIKREVQRAVGLAVDEVVTTKMASAVPKTSSGKVQRHKVRALYEAGELENAEQETTAVQQASAMRPAPPTRRARSRPTRSPTAQGSSWPRSEKTTNKTTGASGRRKGRLERGGR